MQNVLDIAPPPGVRIVDVPDELEALFADRPRVHIYGLVDLEEPFWSSSRWFRRGDAAVGLVGMPGGEELACYAVATRDPAGTLDLLAELSPALPSGLLVTGPVGLADVLLLTRPLACDGPHLRYELADPGVLASPGALPSPDERVVPLGPDDVAELRALYDADPGAAFFLPHMVGDHTFVGVRDRGRLVAAAGTHVVSPTRRIAAIGAVLTLASHRGRGLGRAVTAGVLARLAGRVDVVGLNVATDNRPARRIYEAIGFVAIHPYEEAELARQ